MPKGSITTIGIISSLAERLQAQGQRDADALSVALLRREVESVRRAVEALTFRWGPQAARLARLGEDPNERGTLARVSDAALMLARTLLEASEHADELERLFVVDVPAEVQPISDEAPKALRRRRR